MKFRIFLKLTTAFLLAIAFQSCSEDKVITNDISESERLIDYFAFEGFSPIIEGIIKNDSSIVRISIPFSVDKTSLVPSIRFSEGATIQPNNGVAQDFTDFVIYTVTDASGAKKIYTVIVENEDEPKSNLAQLSAITFPDLFRSGTIDEENREILLDVGFGTDLSKVSYNATLNSEESIITPNSNIEIDLTKDQILTVTAPDGTTTKNYTLKTTILPQETGVRGVWITNVDSDVLDSKQGIEEAVAICDELNINTIFVVTYNKASTTYPSQVMENLTGTKIANQYLGRDPLREMIDAAHARDIKVFAWFEYGFAAYNGSPGPILAAKPTWGAINSDGNQVVKNGFYWLNSLLPEVQNFMNDLVLEVVENYPDIDGIQGDDRLPAMPSEGGYDAYTRAEYAADNGGAQPPSDRLDQGWLQWRANRLNAYAENLYNAVKTMNPNCLVAHSPSPLDFGFREYLQDYDTWVKDGYSDIVSPQLYRRDNQGLAVYRGLLEDQISRVGNNNKSILYPGILSYLGSYIPREEFLAGMILENRKLGITGEVHFFYNTLLVRQKVFKAMYSGKAIFPEF